MTTEQNKSPPRELAAAPWTYDEAGFVLDAKGTQIACIDGSKEDGLLIAAAPELFEALRAMCRSACSPVHADERRAQEFAQRAIAKARGQQ